MAKLQHLSNIQRSKSGIYYLRCQKNGLNCKISLHTKDFRLAQLAKLQLDAKILSMKIDKQNMRGWVLRQKADGELTIETKDDEADRASAERLAEALFARQQRKDREENPAVYESIERLAKMAIAKNPQAILKEIKLADAVEKYIKEELTKSAKAEKSKNMESSILRKTSEFAGDVACGFLTDVWLEDVWLPWRLSATKLATARRDLTFIRAFGKWAAHRKNNYLPSPLKFAISAGDVPKNHYDYFSAADLKKIFDALPNVAENATEFWIPILCLFTGARIGDCAAMVTGEVTKMSEIDTYLMPDKKNKTQRRLPIHKTLIEIGFLEYVEKRKKQRKKLLFDVDENSTNGAGAKPSKKFTKIRKEVGLLGTMKKGHSFRHTITDLLNQAGCSDRAGSEYTGHSTGGDVRAKTYGRNKLALENLKSETIDKIDFKKYCGWELDLAEYSRHAKRFLNLKTPAAPAKKPKPQIKSAPQAPTEK